jgi:type IV secretion system protein VirB3
MAETGVLQTDHLFLGLTRPTMFLGVSFPYVLLNSLITLLSFINTSDFRMFILAFVLHGIGYVLCFKEPLFLELYLKKAEKCNKCNNRLFHGANSYDVY